MRDYGWMKAVLQDLETYSNTNDLHELAEAIARAKVVAEAEISQKTADGKGQEC